MASTTAARSISADLLRKYDRPGPRYTSYPTAVEFSESFDESAYRRQLSEADAAAGEPLSLYVHLPFCEQRCTFCGCMVDHHAQARRRPTATSTYLHREIALLAGALARPPPGRPVPLGRRHADLSRPGADAERCTRR